jgi:hypothetical protein
MVHPNVQAILLTPICPHSLNFRPIILPDYIELELRVPNSARVGAWVCFDGKQRQEIHRGDSVFIKMSENPVPTINRTDLTTDWFESLERCFRWSNRAEQKPFQEDWVMAAAHNGTSGSSYSYDSSSDTDVVDVPPSPDRAAGAAVDSRSNGSNGSAEDLSMSLKPKEARLGDDLDQVAQWATSSNGHSNSSSSSSDEELRNGIGSSNGGQGRPAAGPGVVADEMMLQANGGVPPIDLELQAAPASPATAASSSSTRIV